MMLSAADQIWVADAHEIRIDANRVATMEAVRQDPRNVVPMGDPENQSFFRGEKAPHILLRPHRLTPTSQPALILSDAFR